MCLMVSSMFFPKLQGNDFNGNECSPSIFKSNSLNLLKEANQRLKERLKVKEEEIAGELGDDLQQEKERCKSIENNKASNVIQQLLDRVKLLENM
ncbi:hypothetical protein RHMOL_Rhmol08G0263400 [Rhododendron molle]|uniref:Uncharacterized protein n=1 Tax=Rhododendron molle TaxID=49168 RepID=A0ACC0MUP8_RHOML|nr:hypothetical protein RHMOL_Rhmol08G0263400 [Rhododendron molle]